MVVEKANKVGKKILMSGGGRCNFTNLYVEADNFLSANPHFCKSALSRYTQWDFIGLVEQHGIEYQERKHGQLFCTHSAKDILAMLLHECTSAGVTITAQCETTSVSATSYAVANKGKARDAEPETRYRVELEHDGTALELGCESLVVATGALSIPSLGGSDMGYKIARQFSLPLIERQAGLVPFMFSDNNKSLCERLSGVALPAAVSCGSQAFTENLLFTHRGISGPAVLQISNYWDPGDEITIDLLPEVNAAQWLLSLKSQPGKHLIKTQLYSKLPKALVNELQALWWPTLHDRSVAQCSDSQLISIGNKLNAWQLKPSATEGYRTAEVTRGGVDTANISSKTMAAKNQDGLYFIGEVVDVTGQLGGFNFQWAWSSGHSAGLFA